MDLVETRVLGYFIAVAEELHFGRAAERLGISQPPLSRAIGALERRIGVPLFERTSRQVVLTPAGHVFLAEARTALRSVARAVELARATYRSTPLRLATKPGTAPELLGRILSDDEQRAGVRLVFSRNQADAVRRGEADVAIVCATDDLRELDTEDVAREEPYALLPAGHRLAARSSVRIDELRADPSFSVCPPSLDELVDRAALGILVTVVGGSVRDRMGRSVVTVPVEDLPATRLQLAWREDETDVRVAQLVMSARR